MRCLRVHGLVLVSLLVAGCENQSGVLDPDPTLAEAMAEQEDTFILKDTSGLSWEGSWLDGIDYQVGDAVEFEGSAYIAIQENTASIVPPNPLYWDVLAQKGERGNSGAAGINGARGLQGETGSIGPRGETGPAGANGLPGAPGKTGASGLQGQVGPQGVAGLAGPKGDAGERGVDGAQGMQGAVGIQGPKGDAGSQGVIGPQGETGNTGELGPAGPRGLAGSAGVVGPAGEVGPKGEAGATGPAGERGLVGEQGLKGDTGAQGLKGDAGVQGLKGDTGAQGLKGDAGVQGLKGGTGAQGLKGDTGAQGLKGDTGAQGLKGDTGAQGLKGDVGVQGEEGPKGDQGDDGQIGDQGAMGNIGDQGLQGAEGEQGSQGVAGNEGLKGDSGAQGPKGDVGEQGPKGEIGEQGPKGDVGEPGGKGIFWRGSWSEAESYLLDDAVSYNGGSYIAAMDVGVGITPDSDVYWDVLVAPSTSRTSFQFVGATTQTVAAGVGVGRFGMNAVCQAEFGSGARIARRSEIYPGLATSPGNGVAWYENDPTTSGVISNSCSNWLTGSNSVTSRGTTVDLTTGLFGDERCLTEQFVACSAPAPEKLKRFAGYSSNEVTPGPDGIFGMNAACQIDYGSGARIAQLQEMYLGGAARAEGFAWIEDINTVDTPNQRNCDFWTNSVVGLGYVIDLATGMRGSHACTASHLVACVAPLD